MNKSLLRMFILALFVSCNQSGRMNSQPITIEAYYRQYACGDWNDDMQITKVNAPAYQFLLGKDIDPLFVDGPEILNGWFYDNRTEAFGMKYRLQGFVSNSAKSGCANTTPKFWITKIERLDGLEFKDARNLTAPRIFE